MIPPLGVSPDLDERIEGAVGAHLRIARSESAPERLASALDYAVRPGGARIRPKILLSVALACGDDMPEVSNAAAAALEFVHCASLVHDDLPCFDDAEYRRGKPSVHRAFSEPLAVLAGDSLIMLAFETLARAAGHDAVRSAGLVRTLASRSGMPNGICAGQGWESEPDIDLAAYHRTKTGALFVAATQMGAIAAGRNPEPWFEFGDKLGAAFQVADDLLDACMGAETMGKPSGQDERMGRPNAVVELGTEGAMKRLSDILDSTIASIPPCPGEDLLARMTRKETLRLMQRLDGGVATLPPGPGRS